MQEMSLPWIKIECGLINKPEVMQLAGLLDIDEHTVVGHLVAFWSWVDANMSRDCPDTTGTKRGLDRVAGRDGFTDALVQVGWLEFDGSRVTVPHFEYHLSQSAKTRATDARKKARQRAASRSEGDNVPLRSGQKGGPEKRREEKSNNIESAGADSCPQPARQTASPQRKHPAWLICHDEADAYCGFQTNGSVKQWLLPYSKIDEWRQAFPGVQIEIEINKARQWLIDNPTRRKTASGMLKFLNTWLTKEQNSGRGNAQGTGGRAERRERSNAAAFATVFGADCEATADGTGTGKVVQRKIGDGANTTRPADMGGGTGDVSP